MVQAYEILLCVEHKYCYVLHKLRRVTSPFQCKGDHMQVLFESIQLNRKWDGSNPISVLQPNRRRIEPILATKQNKGWSRPQNVGWSHSNPLIPQPNRRLVFLREARFVILLPPLSCFIFLDCGVLRSF